MKLRRFSAAAALIAPLAANPAVWAQTPDAEDDNVIRIPGLPPIPIPPGARALPDNGRSDIPRGVSPNDRQRGTVPGMPMQLRPPPVKEAAAPVPPPPAPIPPEKRLADLYARLAQSSDSDEAQGIVSALERQWLFAASDTAGLIMTRALGALQRNELPLALELLDKLVALEPQWAEAWNKRATVRFMADDYPGSMEDISHVLALDPNHFGALMGMGTILQRSGNNKRALEAYRRARDVYPALDSVKRVIESLAPEVDGRDI